MNPAATALKKSCLEWLAVGITVLGMTLKTRHGFLSLFLFCEQLNETYGSRNWLSLQRFHIWSKESLILALCGRISFQTMFNFDFRYSFIHKYQGAVLPGWSKHCLRRPLTLLQRTLYCVFVPGPLRLAPAIIGALPSPPLACRPLLGALPHALPGQRGLPPLALRVALPPLS